MCGFVAMLALNESAVEAPRIERMTSAIAHRGPDDVGFFYSGAVGMGFRRLSILDLTPTGHQPMSAADGKVTIVFNGEIYNFVELRRELEGLGHTFRSTGDSEVLLHAYLEWGRDCLPKLNGMWAFVIHDGRCGKLFGARDRFGIKPLFRSRGRDHILFASEIKAILASGLCSHALNYSVAASYLVEGRLDESEATFYADIVQVPPSFAFEVDASGRYSQWRYWSIEDTPAAHLEDPAHAFAELFEDAVRLHMRSDVPVAVHLSGGLDSSSIICASARVRSQVGATGPLMAFSYIAPEFDESAYIRATIAQTRAQMIELRTTPERLWGDLEKMLWYQDEPVHSMTALVGFQLMRVTASHGIKVVLNGQGADETLGGYSSYLKSYWHMLFVRGRLLEAWREMNLYAQSHRVAIGPSLLKQIQHLVLIAMSRVPFYRRVANAMRKRRGRSEKWFTPELLGHLQHRTEADGVDLNSALVQSQRHAQLPIYLRVEDRNSMAHSVEARLPFLDYRLASLAYSLPDNWKVRGQWNKYVLREAMRDHIPELVRVRVDKMGFPVPSRAWLAGALREPVMDLLCSEHMKQSGLYNPDVVMRDVDRHMRGNADWTDRLFDVAQFEAWSTLAPQWSVSLA
jgi:asparagine synthase (glutamine-hydrolysing)